jgi:uncharacterized protein (DUF4415 family)
MNKKYTSSKSQTDWEKIDRMIDEEIDFSDCPEIKPEMLNRVIVRKSLTNSQTKTQVTLSIDSDVWEWFKSQGDSYQSQINCLLRSHMESHK